MQRRVIDMLCYGHVDLSPLITDRFPFSKIKDAFTAVKQKGDTRIKVMIDF